MKRIITLAAVCVLGTAALCFSCLYIRSGKALLMEQRLTLLGNYDLVVYGIEEKDITFFSGNDAVTAYGFYRELGYAGIDDGSQYKIASFPDENSAQMYHMTCVEGDYPQKENEIAIDADIAKKIGIAPISGQKITLTLYDMDRQKIETREYTVSGIFQASSASVNGGFYRYPITDSEQMEGYGVPVIFVSDSEKDRFQSSLITVFLQTESGVNTLAAQIEQVDFPKLGYYIPLGRTRVYSDILGLTDHIVSEYGELNISSLLQAVRDGNVWKDFYSSVLIPLFAGLILVIVAISIFSLVRDIIIGRAREIAILRSIGMTKQETFLYLFTELAVFIGIFLMLGMIVGSVLHYFLVRGMNVYNDTNIPLGFHVNSYVASVTPQPWLYAVTVIGISSALAIFMPLLKMAGSTPISIFKMKYHEKEKRSERHFSDFSNRSWKQVISRHIRFHEKSVLIIMVIIMCTAFFGYNYFRAFTDKENVEYMNELTASGLTGWDFTAEKNRMFDPYTFLIENHHDCGIDERAYRDFAGEDFVKTSFARMVNMSTRLAYPKDAVSQAIDSLMAPFSMRKYESYEMSENTYEHTEFEAEKAMLEQIGYRSDENVYALPTIGVLPEELAALSSYVTDGEIDPEKIESGEEVVLVVPSDIGNVVADAFHTGDVLPLSDIILSEKEENYIFNSMSFFDSAEPAYLKYVEDPSGVVVRYASFAFGTRKDIPTKIGAVVVLDDENLYKKFLVPCQELAGYGSNSAVTYAPCLLCATGTFANWGLPDRLFTEVKFSIAQNKRRSEANALFYKTIGSCKGLTFASSYEIMEKMRKNAGNTMTIYYIMIIQLILLGMFAVGIKFYNRIKLNTQTIAKLRAIGMSLPQIENLILRQNMIYPLIGGAIALIPTFLCQMFFNYIIRQINSGVWGGVVIVANGGETPWYHNVPFRYSLFAYHPVPVLLTIVLIFEALMLLATIPQILYMRKQIIAETMDVDSF